MKKNFKYPCGISVGHYSDVIMTTIASQITSLMIVNSTVYSGADQSKHQSSSSLAFVWGIHRGPVNSPHKWPVTRKMFPFDDVIMWMLQKWNVCLSNFKAAQKMCILSPKSINELLLQLGSHWICHADQNFVHIFYETVLLTMYIWNEKLMIIKHIINNKKMWWHQEVGYAILE